MKLNRDVLITLIIKHQRAFNFLLDYIDEHNEALEVPEQLYLNVYRKLICADDNVTDNENLSIPSLLDNGVFIHHDRSTGTLTIAQLIVDLLRFLDVNRARELTNADFEHMRSGLLSAVNTVIQQRIGSNAFDDAMRTFSALMGEIHSKISENVASLSIQVNYLAHDYKKYDAGDATISVFDLFERVSSLYHRFVLPCYEFISPHMSLVQSKSFVQSIESLSDYFVTDGINRPDLVSRIQIRKTAITSYYKDIDTLTKKLEQYTTHLEKDRRDFLAIESAYAVLLDSLIPLRHGKKRNRSFKPDAGVFQLSNALDGLSEHKKRLSAKFNWESDRTKSRFDVYQVSLADVLKQTENPVLQAVSADVVLEHTRQVDIIVILKNTPLSADIHDLHIHLHSLLNSALEKYKLQDLLYALEVTLPSYDDLIRRSPVFHRNRIDDGTYYLDYVQLEYKTGNVHV